MSVFERYLSVWVALCIFTGVALGSVSPSLVRRLSQLEVSHVNLPIAVLIWLMIYPMMLRIDFAAVRGVGRQPKGILVVLFVNWLVKPFSMAALLKRESRVLSNRWVQTSSDSASGGSPRSIS